MTLVALIGRELTFPATDTGTTSAEEGRQGLVIIIIIIKECLGNLLDACLLLGE